MQEISEKIFSKIFLRKLRKRHYFKRFFKRFNKKRSNFERLDEKHNVQEIFEKIFETFPKKIAKNALFQHIFHKNLANHSLIYCAFGRKTQFVGNFEKTFEILRKIA